MFPGLRSMENPERIERTTQAVHQEAREDLSSSSSSTDDKEVERATPTGLSMSRDQSST
jgi:hypothetical protein